MYHQQSRPLVSVAVITYNSEKTVLDTLDSVKTQTYDNIELVVSDDCSTDDTVRLCKEWISINKKRFVRTQVVESKTNTGIAGNCNRMEKACQGKWIKSIAGDDVLLPSCVSDYVDYVSHNPDAIIVFGKCSIFGGSRRQRRFFQESVFKMDFFSWTAQEQYDYLLHDNCIPASTAFYCLPKMNELDVHYDERIPLLEDWPRWLSITKKGIRLLCIDKVTVRYRLNGISSTNFIYPGVTYYRSLRLFDYLYRYPLSCDGDPQGIFGKAVDYDCKLYEELLRTYNSREYKIGEYMLFPLKKVYHALKRLFSR